MKYILRSFAIDLLFTCVYMRTLYPFVCTGMTTAQIEAENTQMTNDLYRLLKKYTGLRNLIRDLKVFISEPSKPRNILLLRTHRGRVSQLIIS